MLTAGQRQNLYDFRTHEKSFNSSKSTNNRRDRSLKHPVPLQDYTRVCKSAHIDVLGSNPENVRDSRVFGLLKRGPRAANGKRYILQSNRRKAIKPEKNGARAYIKGRK